MSIRGPFSPGSRGVIATTPLFPYAPTENTVIPVRGTLASTPVVKHIAASTIPVKGTLSTLSVKLISAATSIPVHGTLSSTPKLLIIVPSSIPVKGTLASAPKVILHVPSTIPVHGALSSTPFVVGDAELALLANAETWVINMETGAATQYDDFGFNSFAYDEANGRYLAFAEDGVYELTGDTDNGLSIESTLQLAQTNFGTPNLKTVPYAWIGVNSTGTVFLKVNVNGQEYVYQADAGDTFLENQRVSLGRGLRPAYWSFTLTSMTPAEFESITFQPVALDRRI